MSTAASKRAWERKTRLARLERGQCVACGAQMSASSVYRTCRPCRVKNAKRKRATYRATGERERTLVRCKQRYDARKLAGLCTQCGSGLPDEATSGKCRDCTSMGVSFLRKQREERRAKGLCYCGKHRARKGRTTCQPCADKRAVYEKMRRDHGHKKKRVG